MTDLFAARSQMAMSLGFHIIFAVVGMAMPLFMVVAEVLWLRTRDAVYLELAKRWSKGAAIMFAVGAVSGTVLSFELGLLWPEFMAFAGPIIGMPFSLEGFAFFFEAIFLGIYLYGWDRVPPMAHLASGVVVLISGTLSGLFVVTANAWMNTPTGFVLDDAGKLVSIDPLAAMLNPHAIPQGLHMAVASIEAMAFAVMAIHAYMLLRDRDNPFHRRAFGIALAIAATSAVAQFGTGHLAGEAVAHHQPLKLAAMEAHWETETGAGFLIGGIPDEAAEETRYAVRVPYLLSLLATHDPAGEVKGLKEWPAADRPPVGVVHLAFDVMIACGIAMVLVALLGVFLWWRRRALPVEPWFLKLAIAAGPLGLIAIEAGWTVTEVGRQPWIIYELMRTEDAVTPMPGLTVPFLTFSALYVVLGLMSLYLLRRQFLHSPTSSDAGEAPR